MKFLITGGCGFLGSNLASEVLKRNQELVVLDNLSRHGGRDNLAWLKGQGKFQFLEEDTRNQAVIEKLIQDYKPEVIFHLAGQVAMSTSLEDPRKDFEINVAGGFNVIDSVRRFAPQCTVFYSSTNKVYGDLTQVRHEETATRYVAPDHANGFDETVGLDFQSPYGCSKGAMDQYMLDYYRMFGVKTVVFRHSSVFGTRQFSTYDQGWVGWFVRQAVDAARGKGEPFTISGNGKQVRDVLFSQDIVQCYFQALASIDRVCGKAYNIGGGMKNSLSLLELLAFLENVLKVKLNWKEIAWRQSDQKVFVADISRAERDFGWKPKISKEEGLLQMIEWVRNQ